MSESALLVEFSEGRLTLTLNRPAKRNALTRALLEELLAVLRKHGSAADVRLLILQASGSVFCAGMDLAEMQETAKSPEAGALWESDADLYASVVIELLRFPVPTLVVLNGPVLAGGVGLVLACDLVIGTAQSSFSLPEPQRGIVAAVVTPLLNHRLSTGSASWILLSQTPCSGTQAHQWGVIHRLVESDQLESQKDDLSRAILRGGPRAMTDTKRHLLQVSNPLLVEQIQMAAKLSAAARNSSEAREGLAAFLEKRLPRWN